jgi:alpha-mannosidase
LDATGAEIPSQFSAHFETKQRVLVFTARVPACGYAAYRVVKGSGQSTQPAVTLDGTRLENDHLRVVFNAQGEVVSLYDKHAQRECIAEGQRGNVFQLFEDMPGTFEAWDIELHYEDTEFALAPGTIEAGEQGPVFSSLIIRKQILGSPLVQRVRLAREARRVEFETRVDWQERRKLLKVRFHTTIRSRHATYDIAYANIERPTTRNNSFEEAKFEVPGHEWMDLSQPEFGLSLLTDSKYGYECRNARMGLSLLKGPMHPDPESDIETHHFTYALQPHAGTWREAGTIESARDLNVPFHVRLTDGNPVAGRSFLAIGEEGITLEAVKRAEDGTGDIVVRLVERRGRNVTVTLPCLGQATSAHECDLLEQVERELPVQSGKLSLEFAPYQIKSVRFKKAK